MILQLGVKPSWFECSNNFLATVASSSSPFSGYVNKYIKSEDLTIKFAS
jgi:hypothetical protein